MNRRLALCATLGFALSACNTDPFAKALPESYVLLVATGPQKAKVADIKDARVLPLPSLLESGFLSEMLRTAYLGGQLLRNGESGGAKFPDTTVPRPKQPVVFLVGSKEPMGKGVTVEGGFFSEAKSYPDIAWIGVPAEPAFDKALNQTIAGRIARRVAGQIASLGSAGAEAPPSPLVEGYGMAMEVIAREWRMGTGPAGVIQYYEGTQAQRDLFAHVRENHYVHEADGKMVKSAAELWASPGVAATVIYRMAQLKTIGPRIAPEGIYAPFAKDRMPPGVKPAAVLGPFRNFQAKLLSAWAYPYLKGKGARNIGDLVMAYGEMFPAEKAEAIRILVVTTFGGVVKEGGVSTDPKDAERTLKELTDLATAVSEGRTRLIGG